MGLSTSLMSYPASSSSGHKNTQIKWVGIRFILQETPQVADIQGEADFYLLNLDKLFIGPVSLKRLRFTPGEPHRKVVQNSWITERGGVVVKPNAVGGSVGRARCRHRKVVQNPRSVYYYSAVPYSWSIHPPTPERPGARVDEGGGPYQLFYMGVCLPKVGVG